jgi:hypothetical protein
MRNFETKVVAAGPGSIEEALMEALKDQTWEIKAAISTSNGTSSMVRVFLQREMAAPPPLTLQASLEAAGQETLFCECKPPAGVIGSPNCKRCGKPIKDKAKCLCCGSDQCPGKNSEPNGAACPQLDSNACKCIVAVKIKDGGQVCQLCGGDAYENKYVFAHTPEGERLMDETRDIGPAIQTALALNGPTFVELDEIPEDDAPAAKAPKAPKAPKTPKAKTVKTAFPLLEAVQFSQLAQRPKGDVMATHCCIRYGGITAFDRTIAAGTIIREDDLACFPNTALLSMALMRCGPEYKIVQTADKLYLESGNFSAYIPLSAGEAILTAIPDAPVAPLGDEFRDAIKAVGILVKDAGATLLQMAIQLNPFTCIATNGQVIIEAHHGYDMPPFKMLIPKRFADVLNKTKKKIVSFGYSQGVTPTFTVHFEDRSWLRTNLYKEKFKEDLVARVAVDPTHKRPIPAHFFEAAADVGAWSEDGKVYCFDGRISSHPASKQNTGSARTFAMEGFAENRIYSLAALKLIAKQAISMDSETVKGITLFFGNAVRGAVMHEYIEPTILAAARHDKAMSSCGAYTGVCEGYCDGTCLTLYANYKQQIADEEIAF